MKKRTVGRQTEVWWIVLLMLCSVFLVGSPAKSYAEGFPLSGYGVTSWLKMSDYSMHEYSVYDQCLRIVEFDQSYIVEAERYTKQDCDELDQLYTNNMCHPELIPDGLVLPRLTGIKDGVPGVFMNKQKQLGRSDWATVCVLASGKKFAFYNIGKDEYDRDIEKCYNISPLPVPIIPVVVKTVPSSPVIRQHFSNPIGFGTTQVFTTGYGLDSCCCGASGISTGSGIVIQNPSTLQSHGYYETTQ